VSFCAVTRYSNTQYRSPAHARHNVLPSRTTSRRKLC
jgi:hypothetical protein